MKSDSYVLDNKCVKSDDEKNRLFFQDCWLWKKRNSVLANENLVLRELCGLAIVNTIYYEQSMVCLKL